MANNITPVLNRNYEPEQDIRFGTGVNHLHPIINSNLSNLSNQLPMTLPNRVNTYADPYQQGINIASSSAPFMNTLTNAAYINQYGQGERITSRPPLPPPRSAVGNQNYYSSYSNPYGLRSGYMPSYNRPVIGSYSPYSQRPYGSPYNSMNPESGFIEEAHESSREAFASIESIVSAFGSINTMIESTYYALQSSFNAVLSVAENFSRLKSHFSQIFSAFTFIRTLQWLYRKLLYRAGLRAQDPTTEAAWNVAASRSADDLTNSTEKSTRSSWPIFAFLVAVYAGPFLMWKFLSSIMNRGKKKLDWTKTTSNQYYGVAKYNYKAQTSDELSFSAGDYLLLAPKELQHDKSWPLVFNGKNAGQVPINYLEIKYNKQNSSPGKTKDDELNSKIIPSTFHNLTGNNISEISKPDGAEIQQSVSACSNNFPLNPLPVSSNSDVPNVHRADGENQFSSRELDTCDGASVEVTTIENGASN